MGQYYYIINLDKREYLHPHKFGDGLKLMEFGCSSSGTMTALAILLSDGNGNGGGDLRSDNPIIGTWAGDRIIISGDYAGSGLYDKAALEFEEISDKIIPAMLDDEYLAEDLRRRAQHSCGASSLLK